MRRGIVFGLLAASALSAPTFAADGFSYTYLDLGYVHTDIDDVDIDSSGAGLFGSLKLADQVHAVVGMSEQEFDGDVTATDYQFGLGLNLPLSDSLDFVGTTSYLYTDIDNPFGEDYDHGFGASAGLRGRIGEQLELTGGVNYSDFSDFGDNTVLELGARYFFSDAFALSANVQRDEDFTAMLLGVRFNFK